jgi:hypothetical protein
VVVAAMVVADKVFEDYAVWNADFVAMFPKSNIQDINNLERSFLNGIAFNTAFSASDYARYYFALRELSDVNIFFSLLCKIVVNVGERVRCSVCVLFVLGYGGGVLRFLFCSFFGLCSFLIIPTCFFVLAQRGDAEASERRQRPSSGEQQREVRGGEQEARKHRLLEIRLAAPLWNGSRGKLGHIQMKHNQMRTHPNETQPRIVFANLFLCSSRLKQGLELVLVQSCSQRHHQHDARLVFQSNGTNQNNPIYLVRGRLVGQHDTRLSQRLPAAARAVERSEQPAETARRQHNRHAVWGREEIRTK